MQYAHPIKQEECRSLVGMYVCAVMQDGNRHYGIVSRTNKNRLYLNEHVTSGGRGSGGGSGSSPFKNAGANHKPKSASMPKSKAKTKTKAKTKQKAWTKQTIELAKSQQMEDGDPFESSYPDQLSSDQPSSYSPFGTKAVLDLNSIAYLFPVMI